MYPSNPYTPILYLGQVMKNCVNRKSLLHQVEKTFHLQLFLSGEHRLVTCIGIIHMEPNRLPITAAEIPPEVNPIT